MNGKHEIPKNMGFKSDPSAKECMDEVNGTTDCEAGYTKKVSGPTGNNKDNKVLINAHYRNKK